MPPKSEKQRKAAGVALAVKRGERPTSSLMGPARQMLSMSEKQLRDYAKKPNPHPKPRTTRQVAGKGNVGAKSKRTRSPRARSSTAVRTTGATAGSIGTQSTRKTRRE